MDKMALYNLLGKYLNDNCTREERELVDNWLGLLQENKSFASYTSQDLHSIHDKIWQKIQARTYQQQEHKILPLQRSVKITLVKWVVAASVLSLLFLSGIRLFRYNAPLPENSFVSIIPASGMVQQTNTTLVPERILLEDGSLVVLEPGTTLNYPAHFQADKREVYLQGKALFSVSKNAKQPFFIYHNDLVTHVIGTRFIINTKRADKEAEVIVLSGRVEVSENTKLVNLEQPANSNGVILMPNQKVTYVQSSRLFIPAIADEPVPVEEKLAENFNFENTGIAQVLQAVSREYAIDILTENERINACTFTGDIRKQGLYEKLDIICKAINGSYEIKGTQLLLKGTGCN